MVSDTQPSLFVFGPTGACPTPPQLRHRFHRESAARHSAGPVFCFPTFSSGSRIPRRPQKRTYRVEDCDAREREYHNKSTTRQCRVLKRGQRGPTDGNNNEGQDGGQREEGEEKETHTKATPHNGRHEFLSAGQATSTYQCHAKKAESLILLKYPCERIDAISSG